MNSKSIAFVKVAISFATWERKKTIIITPKFIWELCICILNF